MKDETLEDLMPTINPNLDEVVSENAFMPVAEEPPKNDEIFICNNKAVKKPTKSLKKPTKVEEVEESEKVLPKILQNLEVKEKKKYPHLEKARATALANRQRKAKEKADLKELEKNKKLELKEEKKKLRVEKNRTNARNNYHKKQEAKSLLVVEEKEVEKPKTIDKPTPTKTGLSYDEFEKYMDTYNKKRVVVSKPKPVIKPKPVVSKPKPAVSHHPVNYYNPHQRNKIDMDDLFCL